MWESRRELFHQSVEVTPESIREFVGIAADIDADLGVGEKNAGPLIQVFRRDGSSCKVGLDDLLADRNDRVSAISSIVIESERHSRSIALTVGFNPYYSVECSVRRKGPLTDRDEALIARCGREVKNIARFHSALSGIREWFLGNPIMRAALFLVLVFWLVYVGSGVVAAYRVDSAFRDMVELTDKLEAARSELGKVEQSTLDQAQEVVRTRRLDSAAARFGVPVRTAMRVIFLALGPVSAILVAAVWRSLFPKVVFAMGDGVERCRRLRQVQATAVTILITGVLLPLLRGWITT